MPKPIAALLGRVSVGEARAAHNLITFPLTVSPSAEHERKIEYILLDDALAGGTTEITEVSEQGRVPELRVVNRGGLPVLIVDGEELVGAKQNRVVNLTILVPPASELMIPVSCVEAGRWRSLSRAFTAAPRTQYAAGRAKRMAQVSHSLAHSGDRRSDQAEVWADIALKSARLSAPSPTSAMGQMFVDHAASLEDYVARCAPVEGQSGAVFAIGDRIAGFDLFDRSETFRKLLPKLVRSYAIDAIDHKLGVDVEPAVNLGPRSANGFLAALIAAPERRVKAIGLGEDVRLSGAGLSGAALTVDDRVVHLSGFVV